MTADGATRLQRVLRLRVRRLDTPTVDSGLGFVADMTDENPVTHLLGVYPKTTYEARQPTHFHVSDLVSNCIRQKVLMMRGAVRAKPEVVNDGIAATYAIGNALHDFVKNKLAARHQDKLWASWSCKCGATKRTGVLAETYTICKVCKTAPQIHNEVAFELPGRRLTGSPDILLWMSKYAAFHIVEVKSIAKSQWEDLVRPQPDHAAQVALYHYLLRHNGHPVTDKPSVLYVNKDFSFKSPYKEFSVVADDVDITPHLRLLDEANAAVDGGKLPKRTVCSSITCSAAKACPVSAVCFFSP